VLAGGALYAEAYPWLKANVLGVADYGKVTLAGGGLSPWWLIAGFAALSVVLFLALELWERRRGVPQQPQAA
jgi:hypothetical protein